MGIYGIEDTMESILISDKLFSRCSKHILTIRDTCILDFCEMILKLTKTCR